ncbi:MAG TPA: hypothetical protein VI670_22185 [Thermoanaerobaculia bacterium]|jgi:hypothetical protein
MSQAALFSTGQNPLFDESPRIADVHAPDVESRAFDERGFVLVKNVQNLNEACVAIERLIGSIDPARVPLHAAFRGHIQLAKVDLIPVSHEILGRTFQALHFDMGQPLVPGCSQSIYPVLAFFRPPESQPSIAETRVVPLPRLLAQRKFGGRSFVRKRLIDYVNRFGDGWVEPQAVNTLRLACFARFLDAVTSRHELTGCVDSTIGPWSSEGRDAETVEAEYYRACGLDLRAVEERIRIGPGELLIVDNIRCSHGRVGPRASREIYQLLYGVKNASPSMIEAARDWIVEQLSEPDAVAG